MTHLRIIKTGKTVVAMIEFTQTQPADLHLEGNDLDEIAQQTKAVLEEHIQYIDETKINHFEKGVDGKVTIHFYPRIPREKNELIAIFEQFLEPCIVG